MGVATINHYLGVLALPKNCFNFLQILPRWLSPPLLPIDYRHLIYPDHLSEIPLEQSSLQPPFLDLFS